MTCEDWQELIIDVARHEPVTPAARAAVLAHIAHCRPCARSLREQQALTRTLDLLKQVDADASAARASPATVDARVLAAWKARYARPPLPLVTLGSGARAGHGQSWSALAAAAALVAMALASGPGGGGPWVSGRWGTSPRSTDPRQATRAPETPRLSITTVEAPRETTPRRARSARPPSLEEPAGPAEWKGAFVGLPYAEPLRPTEMRQIVRVTIPRAEPADAIAPASSSLRMGPRPLVADVLVGEDGLARAIRIVR